MLFLAWKKFAWLKSLLRFPPPYQVISIFPIPPLLNVILKSLVRGMQRQALSQGSSTTHTT